MSFFLVVLGQILNCWGLRTPKELNEYIQSRSKLNVTVPRDIFFNFKPCLEDFRTLNCSAQPPLAFIGEADVHKDEAVSLWHGNKARRRANGREVRVDQLSVSLIDRLNWCAVSYFCPVGDPCSTNSAICSCWLCPWSIEILANPLLRSPGTTWNTKLLDSTGASREGLLSDNRGGRQWSGNFSDLNCVPFVMNVLFICLMLHRMWCF